MREISLKEIILLEPNEKIGHKELEYRIIKNLRRDDFIHGKNTERIHFCGFYRGYWWTNEKKLVILYTYKNKNNSYVKHIKKVNYLGKIIRL